MSAAPRPEGPVSQSIERLRGEFDRWIEAAWSQGEKAMDAIGIRGRFWSPAADVIEDAESVRVLINLPGMRADDVELTLAGHMLTVGGVLPAVDLGPNGELRTQERATGEFRRSIPLPASVAPESISAVCENGVLTVTVAKSEQEKARKVPVRTGNAPSPGPGFGG